ncbi:MAG TPA: hypothetical protein VHG69_02255 [Thermoleophilaceae bacterium]|nr:hypothetical protein [Thermoleophilaceae bacterium]
MTEAPAGGARDPRDWRDAALVALAGLACLLVLDALVLDSREPRGDELIYELMARDPFGTHTFPFAYRVGVPGLVHLLPFGNTFSFSAIAWLSSGASGGLAYVLMRRFGTGRPLAAALALCLATCPPLLVASLRQGRSVDPESVLVMFAGALAIVDRRPLALGAVVAVGALVRESALFLVPFAYAVWAARPWDPEAARTVALASLPGVALYAALRLEVPTVGREQVLGYGSFLGGRADVLREALEEPFVQARRMASAFGPLWLAAPFALRDLAFARRGLVLLALCGAAMMFAADWGRIVFLAAPVFYVAGGWVLRSRPRLAVAAVVAFAAMNLGYAVYMDRTGVRENIIEGRLPSYPVR